MLEDARAFDGELRLDTSNEWVKLAKLILREEFKAEYAATFTGDATGNVAKSARMALGTLLIKEEYLFSDERIIKEVRMNPYPRHFIGMSEFSHEAPFDASAITLFRKRVTPEMLSRLNDRIIVLKRCEEEKGEPPEDSLPGSEPPEKREAADGEKNQGALILDATCAPQAIRYPTDLSALTKRGNCWKKWSVRDRRQAHGNRSREPTAG
jgi:hypothetical protein